MKAHNQNPENKNKRTYTFLYLITFLMITVVTSGCGSGDLTRSKAQSLIEDSSQFKQISTLSVVTPTEESMKQRGGNIIKRTSADDTPEEAMKWQLENYFEFNTDVGLAQHLDYITVNQKFIKQEPGNPNMMFGNYRVDTTTRTNEKGKALWDEVEGSDAEGFDRDTNLPLAKKEIVEITGINQQNEKNATAEFTYKWNPYLLGKYMDANFEEHKNLPEEVRKSLGPSNEINRGNKLKDWEATRKGITVFQKYDDGWRLQMVNF